jgi:type I restriction enzyme S subunit
MSFPRYPKYEGSGVEWLGDVPAEWEVLRLKQVADVLPSNVDKHSDDSEQPVQLCNYTDVYYNEKITADIAFMAATASEDQIARFSVRAGDTIITKDSETADDIAVSAYVPKDLPGVVCGYHLAVLRPSPRVRGAFIKRIFDSAYAKARCAVAANGLTRVGLGQHEIGDLSVAVPPASDQVAITAFLDHETATIDALVAEQQRLTELLQEKRQAVISHAVTKGLNPSIPMKPSGIDWLGNVPSLRQMTHLSTVMITGVMPRRGRPDRGWLRTTVAIALLRSLTR